MNKLKRQKFEIEMLSRHYLDSKYKLEDHSHALLEICPHRIKNYRRTVKHIEDVARTLPDKQRLIIEHEVMMGKTGTWYLEYFSASSYFRHRAKAYDNFLDCL
ncbi:MAG: hypothetical protein IKX97_07745 [Erysipelotrichaceae bacterium]|nr:hypothetical protein [Erysipelotrichaceae bacterium]MBR5755690.1 hypothetical protein [Erysipelotrichaceae bacterium]